ncbi:unnamed protein product [Larinioides sclopetarius]|uniref:Sushi domain-containing protein n=1 Tax=Larinioides sclopetarius TaxID=280406 RepID=A0AAV1ZHT6_9ARAC
MVYKLHTLKRLYHLLPVVILILMFAVFRLTESMCGKPGVSPNCIYINHTKEYQVGDTVTYYCRTNPCYAPNSMRRQCLENGSWSGTIPFCHIRALIDNFEKMILISGSIEENANLAMDRKNSTCLRIPIQNIWKAVLKRSYRIIAVKILSQNRITEISARVEIMEGNRTVSICEDQTRITDRGNNQLFICRHKIIGNTIRITPVRKMLSSETEFFEICEVYVFIQSIEACLQPDFPYKATGHKISTPPSKYVYQCEEDYELVGDNTVFCQEDGTWTQTSFKCQRMIKCDPSPVIPHGRAELPNGFTYGSYIHITCDPGYMAVELEFRECHKNGSWGNLNICTQTICGPLKFEVTDNEQWVTLNETISIRVLLCQAGYHIEGSPAFTQCLPNGSWSYTTAVCRKTPNFDEFSSEWTPSTVLLSAVAVGAGTAICILCLAMCCLTIKKRRQTSTNSTVFHVGVTDSVLYHERTKEQQKYKANTYEDVIELRNNPSSTKPRKPSSALPHLPIFPVDADPVYAQPFETSTACPKTIPVSTSNDIYTAHIYAEPVDSHRPPSGPGTFTSAAETWLRSGAKKFGRKMSLPGRASLPDDSVSQLSKNIDPVHKSAYESSNTNSSARFDEKQKIADYEPLPTTFSELISNSIYMDAKEVRFSGKKDTEQLQMIDNDIYQDDYFSNV